MEGLDKIKLFEHSCKNRKCTNKFKTMHKQQKQKFCSMLCAGLEVPFVQVPNYINDYDPRGFRSVKEAEEHSDENSD